MAEHDEIVRQAAVSVHRKFIPYTHDQVGVWVADLLAPFFAAARKEAREGALEEAIGFVMVVKPSDITGCTLQYAKGFEAAVLAIRDGIGALRSKPEEPA